MKSIHSLQKKKKKNRVKKKFSGFRFFFFLAHLPPSGSIHSRSPSANGRLHYNPNSKPVVNQAFLNDLHQAMSQKRQQVQPGFPNPNPFLNGASDADEQQESRPFPNRFSSGEYENVQQPKLVHPPPPVIPKRNDETHLTWDRT